MAILAACDASSIPGNIEPRADTAAADPFAASCLQDMGPLDLQKATILDLQAAFDHRQLTSEQLVQKNLAAIAAFDTGGPALNSMRALAPGALDQARAADRELTAGRRASLLQGITVVLKDNVGTTDLPTTAGSIALADNIPRNEAFITQRLRAAGAVVLGKANLSEFAYWTDIRAPSGYSSLGGQVIAPYDFAADPLGSSTGSAVAATTGLSVVAVGTETSGSIISPSTVQSLVGIKPTLGLVSRSGILPLSHSFDTAGPIARNVTDAAILLSVLAGVDPTDDASPRFVAALNGEVPDYLGALSDQALQGARLGVRSVTLLGSDSALFQDALEALRAQGAEIVMLNEAESLLSLPATTELGAILNEFKLNLNQYLATEANPDLPVHTLADIIAYNDQHPDKMKYGQTLLIASNAQT
ncbi:MAG TPA: amidase family protein, partial [Solimonas sp.]|nr:amidase family protein [Solimonas sp.]